MAWDTPVYVTYLILICHFITCFTKIVHIVWVAPGINSELEIKLDQCPI